jgi:coenzyme F420-reducing hydrogenase gamma subunit
LSLLDCEQELLLLAQRVNIAHFLEASSRTEPGPYDLSLVEGSIATAADRERIRNIRESSKYLVTIGACATAGGIQALRNGRDHTEWMRLVYAKPEYLDSLDTSTPISAHVRVDFELRGCPIDKRQLLEVISAFLHGRKPNVTAHATCVECKMAGTICVMVAQGAPCLGPITHAGCGALCPSYTRGCYGCFGPSEGAQPAALSQHLLARGSTRAQVKRMLSTFNAAAVPFAQEAARHDDP